MRASIKKAKLPALAAMLTLSALAPSAAAKVFSFGDSYSDNGNLNVVTAGAQPGPNYWAGRFTNGWTLAERMTFRLTGQSPGRAAGLNGVQYSAGTSVNGGVDFAHGGAVAVPRSTLPKHLSVYNQGRYFQLEVSGRRIASGAGDTAIMWAGLNDYLAYNATNTALVTALIVDSTLPLIASTRVGSILVLNLPNMGDIPGWIDGPRRASLNALTASHNANLASRLAARQKTTASRLILVDINRAMALAHQGLAGGFTVTRPGQNGSVSGNCLGDGKVLWSCPSTYLYYDYVHLTAQGHEYLASITHDRLNSVLMQSARASLSIAGTSAAMARQSRNLSARFSALGDEAAGAEDGRGFGALGVYAFGDGIDAASNFSETGEHSFGAGADLRWGAWVAGAAAFNTTPQTHGSQDDRPELALSQRAEGVSAYMGWISPDASLTLAATHARGDQETERMTTIKGLSVAQGRAEFSASAIEAAASAVQAWGAWSLKGEAALRFDDTRVSAYQETGTLGLSDTNYDAVAAKGLAGRAGLTVAYRGEDLTVSLGAHALSRLSGSAPLEAALPVAIPGMDRSRFDTGLNAPLNLGEQAAAATFSADWRVDDGARLTVEAAAVATQDGDVSAGLSFGAKIEF